MVGMALFLPVLQPVVAIALKNVEAVGQTLFSRYLIEVSFFKYKAKYTLFSLPFASSFTDQNFFLKTLIFIF